MAQRVCREFGGSVNKIHKRSNKSEIRKSRNRINERLSSITGAKKSTEISG